MTLYTPLKIAFLSLALMVASHACASMFSDSIPTDDTLGVVKIRYFDPDSGELRQDFCTGSLVSDQENAEYASTKVLVPASAILDYDNLQVQLSGTVSYLSSRYQYYNCFPAQTPASYTLKDYVMDRIENYRKATDPNHPTIIDPLNVLVETEDELYEVNAITLLPDRTHAVLDLDCPINKVPFVIEDQALSAHNRPASCSGFGAGHHDILACDALNAFTTPLHVSDSFLPIAAYVPQQPGEVGDKLLSASSCFLSCNRYTQTLDPESCTSERRQGKATLRNLSRRLNKAASDALCYGLPNSPYYITAGDRGAPLHSNTKDHEAIDDRSLLGIAIGIRVANTSHPTCWHTTSGTVMTAFSNVSHPKTLMPLLRLLRR